MTMQQLPTPYIFEIDTPLIIFNRRLLQPKSITEADNNYALFYDKKYSIEEIITPKNLESLYFRHNKDFVEDFQQRFMQSYSHEGFISTRELSERLRNNKSLSLIVEKVLPILTEEDLTGRIGNILREDEERQRSSGTRQRQSQQHQEQEETNISTTELPRSVLREIEHMKQRMIQKIEQEYEGSSISVDDHEDELSDRINELLNPTAGFSRDDCFSRLNEDSVLKEFLGNNNLMMIDDKVYSLDTYKNFLSYFERGFSATFFNQTQRIAATRIPDEVIEIIDQNKQNIDHKYFSRIRNKIRSSHLKINNKHYQPKHWGQKEELVSRYKTLLEKKMKIEAVKHGEFQTAEIYRLAQEKERLESLANRQSYERNYAGFIRHSNEYYVYIKTPPYALFSPHVTDSRKRYVPFEPAQIGVRVRYHGGRGRGAFEVSKPVIMHSYRHPFLGDARAFNEICLGDFSRSQMEALDRLQPEKKIIALLGQGKKTLMMGYRTGSNPYPSEHLYKRSWSTWLTKEEVEQRGLIVLNEFRR